ncbi:MAG: AAA-like domain-containing protein, partial [Deltaproteobacteria bacterium]|nr:AAA-like domain-containing protein [Deltaproteobacteria bacterium]
MLNDSIKTFNTIGPCNSSEHYLLPVLPRLPIIEKMINKKKNFIIHSPRQSGKTTFLNFLTNKINQEGRRYAINCSLATLRGVTDEDKAMTRVVSQINAAMDGSEIMIIKEKADIYKSLPGMEAPDRKVRKLLNQLSVDLDKDLVIFFDEADLLAGPGLVTFLAQVRDGYIYRDATINKFPSSLALVGMRDIRDYLTSNHSEAEGQHLASPFNIVSERMTLANFTLDEIRSLYHQHTEATGQVFEESAVDRAWYWTEGQPWLVNALAQEIIENQLNDDYSKIISGINIDQAAQELILRQDAHLDSLIERLKEPRIRRVMEPIVTSSANMPLGLPSDDVRYVLDLGLIKNDKLNEAIYLPANPIYEEILARALSRYIQDSLPTSLVNKWMDGTKADISGLLEAFQTYWKENAELLLDKTGEESDDNAFKTNENLVILVLFAFLQR